MIDYHKTETIRCALFSETESGLFDRHDVSIEVTPDVAISRYVAFEVEKSKSRTIIFNTDKGKIPVQGQFLCIPFDIGRQMSDLFAYERKMYPKTMQVDISCLGPSEESFHLRAKYRDSLAKTRIPLAIENNSIVPLYDVQDGVIPLRKRTLLWKDEFKDNIVIARLWNNKILKIEEVLDDMLKPKAEGSDQTSGGFA
ncbi:MAG: hypothetical protein A2Y56_06675 [Candidatus Aminicenantes bacterium RBG_13_63_10]|nr:MAG: hypothetical protein A2Y56_06675 [Candidatus Aminicenantes bacterium RBG_13_63_10]